MSSSQILLKAVNLSKQYSLSNKPFDVLKKALFGVEFKASENHQVLKSISLEIRKGETLGIMGRNGAGKTTLLSILGNVIQPTSGHVESYCKVATLLGLTAGFNPNFTGRENAYLFCSIQGISRHDAELRMPFIQNFADIGKHFDLPINTYSSGMQARLAFSCAVHVDAELIIIDETLAVGDAGFRIKCYEKIDEMKANGQTFVLVSHNPNLVANFCSRAIIIESGEKVFDGSTFEAIEQYKILRASDTAKKKTSTNRETSKNLIESTEEIIISNITLEEIHDDSEPSYIIHLVLSSKVDLKNMTLNFSIRDTSGIAFCAFDGASAKSTIDINANTSQLVKMRFLRRMLPGRYYITFGVHQVIGDISKLLLLKQNAISFDVIGSSAMSGIADLGMQLEFVEAD